MIEEFMCRTVVTFRGRELVLNRIVSHVNLEQMIPPREPAFSPQDFVEVMYRKEQRDRFINMLSGEIAHALTEALFKSVELTKG